MKTQLKKLNRLIAYGAIDMKDFYDISFRSGGITFQGKMTSETVKRYNKFNFVVGTHGYLRGRRFNLNITLT
jgi:hypothetical protein